MLLILSRIKINNKKKLRILRIKIKQKKKLSNKEIKRSLIFGVFLFSEQYFKMYIINEKLRRYQSQPAREIRGKWPWILDIF